MPICCKCRYPVDEKRAALQLTTCLQCGEKEALEEIYQKMKRVSLAYNKGPYQYMGAPDVAKVNLQGSMNAQGRSTSAIQGAATDTVFSLQRETDAQTGSVRITVLKSRNANLVPHKRKPMIGIMWIDGQAENIFDRNDPRIKQASRKAFFD